MPPILGWYCPLGQWTAIAFFLEQCSHLLKKGTLPPALPVRQRERYTTMSQYECNGEKMPERRRDQNTFVSQGKRLRERVHCQAVVLQLEVQKNRIWSINEKNIAYRINKQKILQPSSHPITATPMVSPGGTQSGNGVPAIKPPPRYPLSSAPRGDSGWESTRCWPQTAEVHIKGRISISPDASIFPYIEKC